MPTCAGAATCPGGAKARGRANQAPETARAREQAPAAQTPRTGKGEKAARKPARSQSPGRKAKERRGDASQSRQRGRKKDETTWETSQPGEAPATRANAAGRHPQGLRGEEAAHPAGADAPEGGVQAAQATKERGGVGDERGAPELLVERPTNPVVCLLPGQAAIKPSLTPESLPMLISMLVIFSRKFIECCRNRHTFAIQIYACRTKCNAK